MRERGELEREIRTSSGLERVEGERRGRSRYSGNRRMIKGATEGERGCWRESEIYFHYLSYLNVEKS